MIFGNVTAASNCFSGVTGWNRRLQRIPQAQIHAMHEIFAPSNPFMDAT
jgi:hypothetical protein